MAVLEALSHSRAKFVGLLTGTGYVEPGRAREARRGPGLPAFAACANQSRYRGPHPEELTLAILDIISIKYGKTHRPSGAPQADVR